jgi:hypothetical protein
MMCDCKECKIVCGGKTVATIECSEGGFTVKCSDACKKMFQKHKGECCK